MRVFSDLHRTHALLPLRCKGFPPPAAPELQRRQQCSNACKCVCVYAVANHGSQPVVRLLVARWALCGASKA